VYLPEAFAVSDPEEVAAMLAAARLGALVTQGPGGLFSSHLPFLHEAEGGRLIGHLARASPHRDRAPDGSEALVIFQGMDAYVSPGWYASKAEHGRVVPTWNYEAIHVHGRVRWFTDAGRLKDVVRRLTDRFEAAQPEPWSIDDAPADYTRRMLEAIVGVEVEINRVLAKRKLSQNRSAADRAGVIAGLSASSEASDRRLAEHMKSLEDRES
jgi:transcriptional regulator